MSEPLRVTHVVLSLDCGGLERVVLSLAGAGRGLGQSVSLLCLERPGTLAPQVEAMGVPLACVDKPPGLRWDTTNRVQEVLRRFRPDVVHTHQMTALLYAGRAARRERTPVVHTEHENVTSRRSDSWARRLRTWLKWRYAGRYADRFCGVSRDVIAAAGAYGTIRRRKLAYIPNGIDTKAFAEVGADRSAARAALGIAPNAPVVGTLGRLAEVKQQAVLIRAFAQLVPDFPAARLVLVGDGPLRTELEELAASLGLGGAVLFAGYRSNPEQYLAAMDIFVLPSRAEAMPLVVPEAWAAGCPVVATRVGGIPGLIADGRTGLLVEPGDADGLVARLRHLLTDPRLARELGRAGRELARAKYDVAVMAGAYDRAYRELLTLKREPSHARPRADSPVPQPV
jgi:glycosyltransferase involved in cell wall biosynthesis